METICKCLSALCPTWDYASIARIYFTSKLIVAYSNHTENHTEAIYSSVKLQKALYQYSAVVSHLLTEERFDTWNTLCQGLVKANLDNDYHAFFDFFTPHLVLDWPRFEQFFPACNDIGRLLVALCLILNDHPLDHTTVSQNWHQERYLIAEKLYKKIGLDFKAYINCWYSVHVATLPNSEHHSSSKITQAMRTYHRLQLPMTDLLHDYAALYLEWDVTSIKKATRGARKTGRTTILPEGGKTEKDQEIESRLIMLAQEQPTDVIRGLFYPPARNDASFECGYLLQYFIDSIHSEDRVLCVNPSPDMILRMMALNDTCNRLCFVVNDTTLAQLYSKQFGYDLFCTLNELSKHTTTYNRLLFISRDKSIIPIPEVLCFCTPDVQVTALMPEACLRKAYDQCASAGLYIQSILTIPTNATQSSPRKKVLLNANAQWSADFFCLCQGYCDGAKTLFGITKASICVPHSTLQSTMTCADMRKAARKEPANYHPRNPMTIRYTPEINLQLTIQQDRGGYVAGRIYYRKILRHNAKDKHRKRGDRLTPVIEKGLRKHSVDEVIAAAEITALDERIASPIIDDILSYYSGKLYELSLKTTWYCLRNTLLSKYTYDENLALKLFSDNSNEIGALCIGTSTADDYDAAMSTIFPEDDLVPKKYWDLLNLILNTAVEKGYIKHNPLVAHMATVNTRLTKRQQEVRNALTKKTFELEEERKMLNGFLYVSNDSRNNWMVSDPLSVVVPIAMIAVPNIREAVTLLWMDFVPNSSLGTYHLQLRRFLASDGVVRPLFDRAHELHRCVPLAPALAQMLLKYKQHLIATYNISADDLALYPIILEAPNVLKKAIAKVKLCNIKTASAKIQEYIAKAEIAPNVVHLPNGFTAKETDLNVYHGSIQYTNLRYHLRHICKFTEGELSYFLGLKAPDTFSHYYCAYDHPALQHRMACKLNRWLSELPTLMVENSSLTSEERIVDSMQTFSFSSENGLQSHADIHITPLNASKSDVLSLEIASNHGVEGTVISIV